MTIVSAGLPATETLKKQTLASLSSSLSFCGSAAVALSGLDEEEETPTCTDMRCFSCDLCGADAIEYRHFDVLITLNAIVVLQIGLTHCGPVQRLDLFELVLLLLRCHIKLSLPHRPVVLLFLENRCPQRHTELL
jgi:hypothetical protein